MKYKKHKRKKNKFVLFKDKTKTDGILRPDLTGLNPDEVFVKMNEWWEGITEAQRNHIRMKAMHQVIKKRKEKGLPIRKTQ